MTFSLLALALLFPGCKGESVPPAKTPVATPQAKPDQKQVASAAPAQEPTSAERIMDSNYAYDPENRPDPFKSILLTGTTKNKQFLPPLQQRDVAEMKVIAIVWGGLGRSAMLQTPDGKGYTVRIGTRVGPNQGVVTKITPRTVIVDERYTDVFGETKTRQVVLELHSAGERIE
jgi:type IV pilus assembly protein PilP